MSEYFVHPQAIVESKHIGRNTRIWAFAHVLSRAVIGEDCNVCDHTFVENDVLIGNRVTIKSGVQLWDGITVEDDVFIGPNATFTNDPFPRSRQHLEAPARTVIRRGASIGANATILPGLTIGQSCMVGAGAVVTHDVPAFAIVAGNPGRITGYAQTSRPSAAIPSEQVPPDPQGQTFDVKGVRLFQLPLVPDLRGSLTYLEHGRGLPFVPRRFFLVFDVLSKEIRGEHAHRNCHQLLLCVKGACSVVVDDGAHRVEILLDRPNLALHIPPMVWATQYKYSQDAVLMVLASEIYEPEDYIRDYDRFLQELGEL